MLLIVICLLIAGCNTMTESDSNVKETPITYPTLFTMEADNFLYELEVNDGMFTGQEPVIIASLTYIGDKEEIVITHATSPFYFDLQETTRGYTIDYFMDMPLVYTTLKKGEPLVERYRKSGGYSDEDAEDYQLFIAAFLEEHYPTGNYAVHGYAQFTIEGAAQNTELCGHIGFIVE